MPSPFLPPAPPRKSRTGLVVTLVLVGLFVLLCCVPVGIFGIRYLTQETGPYSTLPSMCASLRGDAIKTLVGTAEGEREKPDVDASDPTDDCYWPPSKTTIKSGVRVSATLYRREFDSSIDRARDLYNFSLGNAREPDPAGRVKADWPLTGAGNEGFCVGTVQATSTVQYECEARDGNVVITFVVYGAALVKEGALLTAVETFANELARPVLNDVIDDL